ncbi:MULTISPECIES: ATP-binding protein [unclassified Bradyrhizobium]|uniref:sensor histidine kinase n=1 Tax=unclassified Bradyrhizobium TaxID=2631580 RepID=UPI001BCD7BDF|nr:MULTISPECIES: ATP-binding protein [unclassified Bradyrhizobium]MCK1638110.1 HAMP domain-containing protein [Bradyrhizobium sp. 157]WOH50336.1 ATP-binding protein [Bradyrhizobium sp. sBnM-33]
MLRFTLATRLALIAIVGFSAVSIAIIAVFYFTSIRENEFARPSPGRIAAIADLIERSDPAARVQVLGAISSPQFAVRIEPAAAAAGQPVSNDLRPELREMYAAALSGREVTVAASSAASRGRFPRLTKFMANAIELRVALRTGETLVIDASTRLPVTRLGLPLGFGAGLFGTIVALLALLVMQRETRPLARLAAAVDRVDLAADPPPLPDARRSAPEIRALIAAFNRLQARLNEMLRARMTLVGGIAHDVRTFATRLRLRVEKIPDPAEQQKAIADIDDMISLLDDALLSSRVGAGQLSQEMVDFSAFVGAEVDDRRAQGNAVDVAVDEASKGVFVLGDQLALRRIVANVIDNAVKYGRVAHVRTRLEGDTILVIVDDEGPGIPADQRRAMLEPFNRLETSRNRATGGAGLGLAVVRSLVEAHGGSIEVTEAAGGGTSVSIALPVFRPG